MKENANLVTNMLNNYSFKPTEFCLEMMKQHRTLQQSFTRLCIAWIKLCATEEYNRHTDDRNKASHVKCKAIVDAMSKDDAWSFLPFI